VVGAVVWIGGLAYQTHVLLPAARRGDPRTFAQAARRARPATWTAVALVALSGFYNVTQLGSLEHAMQSGVGLLLATKLGLVIVAVTLAAQRDFAQVPILDPARVLAAISRLDRVVLLLALVIIYLGLAVSRA
jgi:putative copper export protein